MWNYHVERPLTPIELGSALEIELGSTDFNIRNKSLIATLMSRFRGLNTQV